MSGSFLLPSTVHGTFTAVLNRSGDNVIYRLLYRHGVGAAFEYAEIIEYTPPYYSGAPSPANRIINRYSPIARTFVLGNYIEWDFDTAGILVKIRWTFENPGNYYFTSATYS